MVCQEQGMLIFGEQEMLWFFGSRGCCGLSGAGDAMVFRSRERCGLSTAEIISEPVFVLTMNRSVAIWPFPRC